MSRIGASLSLFVFVLAASLPLYSNANDAIEIIELWPEGVPGLKPDAAPERVENGRVVGVHHPSLSVYLPDSGVPPARTAVVYCPGGGYHHLTIGENGGPDTQWLNSLGVTVFVLKYRMLEYGHPAPLQDAVQAIRVARERAADFGIAPNRIGILGASAGGHAAASAATLWDHPLAKPEQAPSQIDARPDFAILVYPVITMDHVCAHKGSRENLIGLNPSADTVNLMSIDKQVKPNTPPALLIATGADRSVPVENSLLFYQALRHQGVPVEMHLYAAGSHGNSLDPQYGPTAFWPQRAEEWLRFNGWIE